MGVPEATTTDDAGERINFISGGTLFQNDDDPDKVNIDNGNAEPSWLDPVVNNNFNLVQTSLKSSERRYALSKFNDMNIFKLVRTYLAFLHNQSPNVCIDGHTKLSIEIFIRSSGLPTCVDELRGLFTEFVSRFGITEEQVMNDLLTMRKYISSDRIHRLQRNDASMKSFLGFH